MVTSVLWQLGRVCLSDHRLHSHHADPPAMYLNLPRLEVKDLLQKSPPARRKVWKFPYQSIAKNYSMKVGQKNNNQVNIQQESKAATRWALSTREVSVLCCTLKHHAQIWLACICYRPGHSYAHCHVVCLFIDCFQRVYFMCMCIQCMWTA